MHERVSVGDLRQFIKDGAVGVVVDKGFNEYMCPTVCMVVPSRCWGEKPVYYAEATVLEFTREVNDGREA